MEEQPSTWGKSTEPESELVCLISNKVPANWMQSVQLILQTLIFSSFLVFSAWSSDSTQWIR